MIAGGVTACACYYLSKRVGNSTASTEICAACGRTLQMVDGSTISLSASRTDETTPIDVDELAKYAAPADELPAWARFLASRFTWRPSRTTPAVRRARERNKKWNISGRFIKRRAGNSRRRRGGRTDAR